MAVPSAFLVVGHRNWGKSTTIRALTRKSGWFTLHGQDFFVRMMSNDDLADSYKDFVARLDPRKKPYVLIAYCPEKGRPQILEALAKKYRVHFFALEHKATGEDLLSPNDVAELHRHGIVRVFSQDGASPTARAAKLKSFIVASM